MIRKDYLAVANFYAQDFPVPGFTSEATAIYNWNREGDEIHLDENGFPARPALLGDDRGRDYDVVYLGYSGDGHFGDVNLTVTGYGELGQDRNNIFTDVPADISGYFFAAEPSMDFDWIRVRLSGLYASGDDNPYDNHEGGFDAIFENPQFAGADTSYWIRQSIPFVGGGRDIFLNSRNGVLNRPALLQGGRPVQLQQSRHHSPGRGRGLRRSAGAARLLKPQSSVVRRHHHRGSAAPAGQHLPGSGLGCLDGPYLAAVPDPEHRASGVGRGAVAGRGLQRPVHHQYA